MQKRVPLLSRHSGHSLFLREKFKISPSLNLSFDQRKNSLFTLWEIYPFAGEKLEVFFMIKGYISARINAKFHKGTMNTFHSLYLPVCHSILQSKKAVSIAVSSPIAIYDLALRHRKALEAIRNVAYVQTVDKWVLDIGGVAVPCRRRGRVGWIFTNQVITGFDKFDLGSEKLGHYFYNVPFATDRIVAINKFRGGYIIDAGMRNAQWRTVAKKLEEMMKD